MTKGLLFAAVFGLSLLSAAPVTPDINGNFADKGKNWYVPAAKFSVIKMLPSGELQLNRHPNTPYGDLVCGKAFEIKPGDVVAVTFTAKGEGPIGAGIVSSTIGNCTERVVLTPEFKEHTVIVNLKKVQSKLPGKVCVKFIIAGKVDQLTLKNCKAVINPEK